MTKHARIAAVTGREPPEGRYTHRGALEALWAAHDAREESYVDPPERWLWRYRRAMWVNGAAATARVRLPRSLFEEERARMREDLARYAARVPAKQRHPDYEKAQRWAERDREDRR